MIDRNEPMTIEEFDELVSAEKGSALDRLFAVAVRKPDLNCQFPVVSSAWYWRVRRLENALGLVNTRFELKKAPIRVKSEQTYDKEERESGLWFRFWIGDEEEETTDRRNCFNTVRYLIENLLDYDKRTFVALASGISQIDDHLDKPDCQTLLVRNEMVEVRRKRLVDLMDSSRDDWVLAVKDKPMVPDLCYVVRKNMTSRNGRFEITFVGYDEDGEKMGWIAEENRFALDESNAKIDALADDLDRVERWNDFTKFALEARDGKE